MDSLNEFLTALVIVGWICGFGLASGQMAVRVERRPPVWFVIGAILGPIALLVLRTAPPGRCRACGTPTRGWHRTCWWCHEDVRLTPASTLAILERMSGRIAVPEAPAPAPRPGRPERARPFVIQAAPTAQIPPAPPAPPAPTAAPADHATTPPTTPKRRGRVTSSVATSASSTPLERNGSTSPSGGGSVGPAPADIGRRPGEVVQVLATAVFVAGSARLEPGHRYGLALRSTRFLILGPTDVDPSTVILDRGVADLEVHTVDGRFIVSESNNRSGLVLAFMSVAGASPADLESAITSAARAAPRP